MKSSALVLVLAFTASSTMAAEGSKPAMPMSADEMANQMLDFTRNVNVVKAFFLPRVTRCLSRANGPR
jgi:hypothetical protein